MESRTAREEKTLDIGTALGGLVVVLVVGHVLLRLADWSVGLSDDVAAGAPYAIILVACAAAVAYLMRAGRRGVTGRGCAPPLSRQIATED